MRNTTSGCTSSICHLAARRAALLSGICLAGLGLAYPAAGAEVQISGTSPFATCTADNVGSQPGINYLDSEVEPWVDVNPVYPNNLIAGWQQDRWSNGGARGLVSGYSNDGGATWTPVVVPGISLCSGGDFERATDPWVSFSPDGVAYFMSLSFNNDLPTGSFGANSMLVSRSTNGGATWSAPIELSFNNDGQSFDDKNSITADPTNSNYVYAVWDRLIDFTVPPISGLGAPAASAGKGSGGGADGVVKARKRFRQAVTKGDKPLNKAAIWTGPTYFTRTTNGGTSWEEAKIIVPTGNNEQTIGNIVEVLPDGTIINFFTHLKTLGWGGVKFGMVHSSDKGATFGPVTDLFQMVVTTTGTLTPDAKAPVRDANILFDTAVDRQNGNIYVVWQDSRARNIDQVAFSMSTNGGVSWSTPVIINKTPFSANKLRNQAFVPSVVVGDNHKVVVTYYDFRNDVSDGKEATDFWAISCDIANGANCRTAAGWGSEVRLTATPFDILDAPVARGHFLGDYMGLAKQGSGVIAVYGKAVAKNKTDIFASQIP